MSPVYPSAAANKVKRLTLSPVKAFSKIEYISYSSSTDASKALLVTPNVLSTIPIELIRTYSAF